MSDSDLSRPKSNLSPSRPQPSEERQQRARSLSGGRQAQPIQRRAVHGPVPLSFAQQRLWFLDKMEPGNPAYNISSAVRLRGRLSVEALGASFNELVKRHETLRTGITTSGGQPVQLVAPSLTLALPVIECPAMPEAEREPAARRLAREEARRPFDLSRPPLMRASLLRFAEDDHVLLMVLHHIVSDGWSMDVLLREVVILYESFLAGRPSPLPELPIQYADFALWQREWLQGEVLDKQLSYWRGQLAGIPPRLELPTDRPHPATQDYRGEKLNFELSPELTQGIKELSRREGATPFITLLAAFQALLHRYTRAGDISVGTPIANRHRGALEPLIGFFVNTLVIRSRVSPHMSFRSLLGRVRETAFAAYAHQDVPFERLVNELKIERQLSHSPLFQVMFVLQSASAETVRLPSLDVTMLDFDTGTAKFDLSLSMTEAKGRLGGSLYFKTALFDASTVRRLLNHFEVLLGGIVSDPERSLSDLPLLTAGEREELLTAWNRTEADFPLEHSFAQLFEAQALRSPHSVAVSDSAGRLTYRQLDERANRLAVMLLKESLAPEQVVPILAPRGTEFLTALLAVFKAGGAYLPLDPNYPAARTLQMLERSGAKVLLAARALAGQFSAAPGGVRVLEIEALSQAPEPPEHTPSRPGVSGRQAPAESLAYVIYTSGSTGVPKGAMVEQRGMVNHLFAKIHDLGLTVEDVVAQTASQSFDISVWQFLAPLLTGGRVEVFDPEVAGDPRRLLEQVERRGVTILEVVPSLLQAMVGGGGEGAPLRLGLRRLRWLLVTGEALPAELCRRWLKLYPHVPLLNAYGPTECSDDVTHYAIRDEPSGDAGWAPLGRPVANTQIYILDGELQPVPFGVAGELCVGGTGVGRGYFRDGARTAEVFVPDPFTKKPGGRLYRTGDLARRSPGGDINFLGRLDHQVKIRGFRIEVGEIEAVLSRHEGVRECAVLAREGAAAGDKRLVAYLTLEPGHAPKVGELRAYLKERLPEYMEPAAFVVLDEMPLTRNGKVDREALPAPDESSFETETPYVAPRNPLEELLVQMWQDTLGVKGVGVQQNFFELGGDSIRGAVFINELQERLGELIYVAALFGAPTVAELSTYLKRHYADAVARMLHEEVRREEAPRREKIDAFKLARIREIIEPPKPLAAPGEAAAKNPQAVFILSPPRSGSTLLRVMLGGHSGLFAPPELELLGFNTLAERRAAFSNSFSFYLEGTQRAVMELLGCDAGEAGRLMHAFEEQNVGVKEFYAKLQSWGAPRRLVDKTPSYALSVETMRRAEEYFQDPLYIHLLRDPRASVRSFEEAKLEQVFFRFKHPFSSKELAELVWVVSHQNILEFLRGVPPERQLPLRFEDLVRQPDATVAQLCRFLKIEMQPAMLEPYQEKRRRMTDGVHNESRMLGDIKFHQHAGIDPAVAERGKDVPDDELGEITWEVAETLGYRAPRRAGRDTPAGTQTPQPATTPPPPPLARRRRHETQAPLDLEQLSEADLAELLNRKADAP